MSAKSSLVTGAALVAGAVAAMVTMVLHPTAAPAHNVDDWATFNAAVHVLGMMSAWLLIAGYFRFTMSIRATRPLADLALVAFAIGMAVSVLPAARNGLLAADVARQVKAHASAPPEVWPALARFNFMVDEAFVQVYIAGTALGILFWSIGFLSLTGAWPALGVSGILASGASLLALVFGHLRTNVHDVGLFVLASTLWTIVLAILVFRSPSPGGA